ncbi:UNVERIFIED_CONTAM: recombinase [Williamsia faeni]
MVTTTLDRPRPRPRRQRRRARTAPPDKVVAYLRVSTEEQAESGLGLAAQRAAITAEAERRGWEIVAWHVDEGISAKFMDTRPGFVAAIAEVEADRAAGVVAAKLDRISRSTLDTELLTARAEAEGWFVVACDTSGIDTSTPMGRAMVKNMAVFNQLERELIGQRTREALAEKRAQGVRLGRPSVLPLPVVQRILDAREAGLSYPAIAKALNDDAVPTARGRGMWYPATVRQVEHGQDAARLREGCA